MRQVLTNWIAMCMAFFVGGPIVSEVLGLARSSTGGSGVNAMFAEPVALGLAALVGATVIAGVFGLVGAKVGGAMTGFRCAGFALVWGAFESARMGDLLRHHGTPYIGLAIEALVAGAVVLFAGILMVNLGQNSEGRERGGVGVPEGVSVLIVAVVGMVVCGAVARTEMFGQCIAATIFAGVVGTLVARMKFPRVSLVACLAGCVVLGVGLQLVAMGIEGSDGLRDMFLGRFLAVARPMPLDWVAGGLIGVPMGASWAASMVERQPAGEVAASGGSAG